VSKKSTINIDSYYIHNIHLSLLDYLANIGTPQSIVDVYRRKLRPNCDLRYFLNDILTVPTKMTRQKAKDKVGELDTTANEQTNFG
jgi:hypothetical protein